MSTTAIEAVAEGSRAGWRPRVAVVVGVALALAVGAYLLVSGWARLRETRHELQYIPTMPYDQAVDFTYFYSAAMMVHEGDAADLYPARGDPVFYPGDPIYQDPRFQDRYTQARMVARGSYYNPPLVAVLESPLAALSFRNAFWVYSAISVGALVLSLALIGYAGRSVREVGLLILGIAAFRPVHEAVIMGHQTLFFLLALTAGFLALRARHQVLAGLALSLLALKPQWAILPAVFLLVRREWRALATMTVASAALFFLPFLATGSQTFGHYVAFLRDASKLDIDHAPHMFSWNGFFYKLHAAPVSRPLLYGCMGLTGLALAIVWLGRDFYLGVAATITAMLLLSTHSVWYDWSFLAVAAAFLLVRPSSLVVRAQAWIGLLAVFAAADQSMSALLYPWRHFIDWERTAVYSLTPVAFGLLVWMAGLTVWTAVARYRGRAPSTTVDEPAIIPATV